MGRLYAFVSNFTKLFLEMSVTSYRVPAIDLGQSRDNPTGIVFKANEKVIYIFSRPHQESNVPKIAGQYNYAGQQCCTVMQMSHLHLSANDA